MSALEGGTKMVNPDTYAKMLVGWFAIRSWDEMATDRFSLRRRVRSGGGNPPWDINEPTKDDLRSAAAEIVAAVNSTRAQFESECG